MRESKLKAILLSSLMVIGALHPMTVPAQLNGSKGLFGKGNDECLNLFEGNELEKTMILGTDGLVDYEDHDGGLFKRGRVSTDGLYNQGFGEIPTGITNEPFQENAPLGNGLFIMLVSGVGYAALKKKNKKETNQ